MVNDLEYLAGRGRGGTKTTSLEGIWCQIHKHVLSEPWPCVGPRSPLARMRGDWCKFTHPQAWCSRGRWCWPPPSSAAESEGLQHPTVSCAVEPQHPAGTTLGIRKQLVNWKAAKMWLIATKSSWETWSQSISWPFRNGEATPAFLTWTVCISTPSPRPVCWNVMLSVRVSGGGAFGRQLGLEGGALKHRLRALMKETPESSLGLYAACSHSKRMESGPRQSSSPPAPRS